MKIAMVYPFEEAIECIWYWKNETPFCKSDHFPFFDSSGRMFPIKLSGKAWQKIKLLKNWNYSCACCLRKAQKLGLYKSNKNQDFYSIAVFVGGIHPVNALTIDHIVPKDHKGSSSVKNYQILCGRCNVRKGNKKITIPQLRFILRNEISTSLINSPCDVLIPG